jgi:hypothetical protein
MATALKNRDYPLSKGTFTSQDNYAPTPSATINEHAEMSADLDVTPERFVVREISFLMDSDGLQFLYKDSTQGTKIPSVGGIRAVVPELTEKVFSAALGLKGSGLATAETPLDLALEGGEAGPAYLVFKLDPRLNWRFSKTEPAITLKDDANSRFYGDLTYVDDGGKDHKEKLENCRLVFFKANPPAGEYRHGFNFNVELIQRPHVGPDEPPRILPITIDPDIRFPGGSMS